MNPNRWVKLLITTHRFCVPEIFSCHCNLQQQNNPIPASCWPFVVRSELDYKHFVVCNGPCLCWELVGYVDVNSLLYTPLKPALFPIQNFHFVKVCVVARRLNVNMLGDLWRCGIRSLKAIFLEHRCPSSRFSKVSQHFHIESLRLLIRHFLFSR